MKKIIQTTALAFLVFNLSGCQQGKPDMPHERSASDPAPHPPGSKTDKPTLIASVRATPKPNQYMVVLEWNGVSTDPEAWTLDKLDGKILTAPFTTLAGSVRRFTDLEVKAGKTYTYSLKAEQREETQPLESATVAIPRDLEIKGAQTVSSLPRINRLFLYPDSHLITMGREFHLDVNEIVSEDGTIESFPEKAVTAPAGANGRSGEAMNIRAKRGTGILHVVARGEDGVPGSRGANGIPGANGAPGYCFGCGPNVKPGHHGPVRPFCDAMTAWPGRDGEPGTDARDGYPGATAEMPQNFSSKSSSLPGSVSFPENPWPRWSGWTWRRRWPRRDARAGMGSGCSTGLPVGAPGEAKRP